MAIGILCITFQVEATSSVLVDLQASQKFYHEQCKSDGKGHDNRPPHTNLYVTLLPSLIAIGPGVGQLNLDKIKEHNANVVDYSHEETDDYIKTVRIQKAFF